MSILLFWRISCKSVGLFLSQGHNLEITAFVFCLYNAWFLFEIFTILDDIFGLLDVFLMKPLVFCGVNIASFPTEFNFFVDISGLLLAVLKNYGGVCMGRCGHRLNHHRILFYFFKKGWSCCIVLSYGVVCMGWCDHGNNHHRVLFYFLVLVAF